AGELPGSGLGAGAGQGIANDAAVAVGVADPAGGVGIPGVLGADDLFRGAVGGDPEHPLGVGQVVEVAVGANRQVIRDVAQAAGEIMHAQIRGVEYANPAIDTVREEVFSGVLGGELIGVGIVEGPPGDAGSLGARVGVERAEEARIGVVAFDE